MSLRHSACVIAAVLALIVGGDKLACGGDTIQFERVGDVLFVRCSDLAKTLEYEFKVVQPGRLITFCRNGDEGFCIPIQLTTDSYRGSGDELMLSAAVVSNALRVRILEADGHVSVKRLDPQAEVEVKVATPGYNADWGQGRGFRTGETLPDIPLVDMQGNEVRFSQFLGKRYVLYCWASW